MKYGAGVLLVVGILALGIGTHLPQVRAAIGLDIRSTNTTNPMATTTVNYMTPGTGTTTLSLYTANTDQVDLNVLYNASGTQSILKWRYEESPDNLNWYADSNELVANATTTTVVRDFAEYSWVYATSTAGTSQANVALKHIKVPNIASPYWRAVFYVPAGAGNGAVYVQSVQKSANPI